MARHLLGGLVCALLGACGGSLQPDGGAADLGASDGAAGNAPGKHVHALVAGGQMRETIVYVPARAQAARAPVVFMLHGTSGDGERFYQHSGWKEKSDQEGMITVFPSALTHCFHEDENRDGDYTDPGERKVTTKWSGGKLGEDDGLPLCTAEEIAALPADKRALVDHPIADDMAFFDALLELLAKNYVVDDKAIYVTGFSNGGNMSSRLLVERAHKIAAGNCSAGGLAVPGPATRPISINFSVGSKDDRFTTALGVSEIPLTEMELVSLPGLQEFIGRYLDALQLTDAYTYQLATVDGKKVARLTFSTSKIGASNSFEAFVIEDLFHQYPNGNNHPVSAPDHLWTFFRTQRLP